LAERSCILTRQKADQADLVRLVLSPEGGLFVDYRAKLPGRGAWVCPQTTVLKDLERKPKVLARAFQQAVDPTGLLEKVRQANRRALLDALSLAARSGALVGGGQRVRDALNAKKCAALIFAEDASPRLKADLERRAEAVDTFFLDLDREAFGAQIGKGPRAAMVVISSKPGRHLIRELQRHHALR
jgi:predicted RNA-binding protein YlxR (DUF448 family)